jgi:hypothetical protein
MLLVCDQGESMSELQKIFDKINSLTNSCLPTRVLLICSSSSLPQATPRNWITLATLPVGFPLVLPEKNPNGVWLANERFPVILALNRESMLIDPIDWLSLRRQLSEWSGKWCPEMKIPIDTDHLFGERAPLNHKPRVTTHSLPLQASGIYHFFDPEYGHRNEINHFISLGIPHDRASLINRINSHDRSLSMIGILPNQLRRLFNCREDYDSAFEALSKELFWHGYNIWNTRRILMSRFWKKIAPEEWKTHSRLKKKKGVINVKKCKSPFHFMIKHSDLTHSKPTPCLCSRVSVQKIIQKLPDIKVYLSRYNYIDKNFDTDKFSSLYITHEELIRGAHDRGKNATV